MTYYDSNARERHDRMIVAYQFDSETEMTAHVVCSGGEAQVVIDLGGSPLELELVIHDVVAMDGLINGLAAAREGLIEHLAEHATQDTGTDLGDPNVPLFIPDNWAANPDDNGDSRG